MTPAEKNKILTQWLKAWSKGNYNHISDDDRSAIELFDQYALNIINARQNKNVDDIIKALYEEMQAVVLSDLSWLTQEKYSHEYQYMLDKVYTGFHEQLKLSIDKKMLSLYCQPEEYYAIEERLDFYYYNKLSRGFTSPLVTTPQAMEAYRERITQLSQARIQQEKINARNKLSKDISEELEPLIDKLKKNYVSFFSNKSLIDRKLEFLKPFNENLKKITGDVNDKSIINAVLNAANNHPLVLHQALQSKTLNEKINSMLSEKPKEGLLTKALKQKLDNHTGDLRALEIMPVDTVGASILNAYLLAEKEIDELKRSWSPKLKLTKIDFLAEFITIMQKYKEQPLAQAQENIRQDLFSLIRDEDNLKHFNKAIEGKRVKNLVLEITGFKSTKELFKAFPSASAMDVRDQLSLKTVAVGLQTNLEAINNLLSGDSPNKVEFASKALRDFEGYLSMEANDIILPKFKDGSKKSPEDIRQLACFLKDTANFYRLGEKLAKWESDNNGHRWHPMEIKSLITKFAKKEREFLKEFTACVNKLSSADQKQLSKYFTESDKKFHAARKIIEDNIGFANVRTHRP